MDGTRDGIEYRVSILPFGGYVALPQMADLGRVEGGSDDDKQEHKKEPLPPISLLDKVIVTIMGPLFNIIFCPLPLLNLWIFGQPVAKAEQTTTIGYVQQEIETSDGKKSAWASISCRAKARR